MGDARRRITSASEATRSAALSVISRRPGKLLVSAIFLSGMALNGFLVSSVPMVTDRGLPASDAAGILIVAAIAGRSEENPFELLSLMRMSHVACCLRKKKTMT